MQPPIATFSYMHVYSLKLCIKLRSALVRIATVCSYRLHGSIPYSSLLLAIASYIQIIDQQPNTTKLLNSYNYVAS